MGCNKLKSINIPEKVTKLNDDLFKYCYNLSTINIPNTITSIGSSGFLWL